MPRHKTTIGAAAGALLLALTAAVAVVPQARADTDHPVYTQPCAAVEAVFARGSGQKPGEPAAANFEKKLGDAVAPVTFNFYEVGDHELEDYSYPAVNVADLGNGNAAGAAFSGGQKNDYGRSVDEGASELGRYLQIRGERCKSSVFVMGGFSQGAQVIGETYDEKLSAELRGRVVYNALFGDPKLFLPEGRASWGYTPACHGEGFSEWRFDVPDCTLDNGSLGSRMPYLPEGWTHKTGLWCNNKDFVCGSSLNPKTLDGHRYEGEDTDAAVAEIVKRLKTALPAEEASKLRVDVVPIGVGTTGLDMVFIVDTTGSMGGYIDEAKRTVAAMSAWVEKMRGRVALVEYRDSGDEFTARILSGLQGDTVDLTAKLAALRPDGGNDIPEALLHGLMTALNGLEWRNGATKAAVVLTDADFHDPDIVDGSTLEQVAKRALEIDPVNVYPVVDSWLAPSYQELAEATSGQVILNEGDTAAALQEALQRIETRPVVLLPLQEYFAPVGGTVTFDASKSYANAGATITAYDWDFDGDGTFDATTTTPVQKHMYGAKWDGVMQVRATDSNGLIANMSAVVHIGTSPLAGRAAAPTDVQAAIQSTTGTMSTVSLGWLPADGLAESWVLTVDGFPVGRAEAGLRSVTISEVDRSERVVLGVAGVNAAGEIGEYGTVELAAADAAVPTPSPTTTTPAPETTSPAPTPSTDTPGSAGANSPTSAPVQPAGAVSPTETDAGSGGGKGILAFTGASMVWALAAGLVLVGVGTAVVAMRRGRVGKQ